MRNNIEDMPIRMAMNVQPVNEEILEYAPGSEERLKIQHELDKQMSEVNT